MGKFILIEQLRACAEASKNFVNGLIGEVAGTVADALEELDTVKSDKSEAVAFTIPTTGWAEADDEVMEYPYYYDHPVTGLTAKDRATVTIAPQSVNIAREVGICTANETIAGAIRLRSTTVPTEAMQAEYWIDQGKE